MTLANEVNFFPDKVPFLEPCFHNMEGFTERNLANFRLPIRPLASKKGERFAHRKESTESIGPMTHLQNNSANMLDVQTQIDDALPQDSPKKTAAAHCEHPRPPARRFRQQTSVRHVVSGTRVWA